MASSTATSFTKDLTLVPDITFGFVEDFIKSHSTSSGKEQMTKGFKYYSEQYVHSVSGKFSLVNNARLIFSAHVKLTGLMIMCRFSYNNNITCIST